MPALTSPEPGFEILAWDSGVFGFPVARVSAVESRQLLAAALDEARRSGVRLAYLFAGSPASMAAAQAVMGDPISERLTFVRVVPDDEARASTPNDSIHVEQLHASTPTSDLITLARDAGQYSRFKVDPRIPTSVFEQIYDAWIANSLNKTIADVVLVTRENDLVSALVTVGSKHGRADIGLLAVSEHARGRGLGRALVQASLEWAVRKGFRDAQVVTQRANTPACRLYSACGYSIERAEHVFHFWM